MTDIGNKANVLQNAKNINKGAIKKEIVKPARGLSKQKATTSLNQLTEVTTTRVTRRSAEKCKEELMEQDVSKADIEMADLESKPVVTAYSLSNLENVDN